MVIDSDSESGFLYGSMMEFIKCWENRASSRIVLETCNGQAWVNLSCCLGRPSDNHVIPARRSKTKKKEEKDIARAAVHQQKMTREASEANDKLESKDENISGFVDCDLDVKCSLVEKSEDNLKLISESIEESFKKLYNNNDVEIVKVVPKKLDKFRDVELVNRMEFINSVRIYFRQIGDNNGDVGQVLQELMCDGAVVPVAHNWRYPKIGRDGDIKVHSLKIRRSF